MKLDSKIKKDIPLAPLTTFKIGGPAKYYVEINSMNDLIGAYDWAREREQKVFILAGGSNVLINDKGVNGLVIKLANKNSTPKGERIECGAGAELSQVVRLAISNVLSGLEWATGIPGSLGGAVRGNAGAFGYCMADIVETVEVFDLEKIKFILLSKNDCRFNYRNSLFKEDKSLIIWQITLRLKKGNTKDINLLVDKNINYRKLAQPKLPSAGCIFKNVFINDLKKANSRFAKLAQEKGIVKEDKVSIGWLIKEIIEPGKKIGGAKISLE
ncbi:UDP-N-acetylmuramate dehydrogenase, partial [Patescibacteria group bacterium]